MDQIPLRPAEDPRRQEIETSRKSIKVFTKPTDFSFSQKIGNQDNDGLPGYAPLRTEGEIHIRVSNRPASEQCIEVETDLISNDPALPVGIVYNENGISITSPPNVLLTQDINDPHVFIRSTIHISRNLRLRSFHLETASLAIFAPHDIPVRSLSPITISAPSSLLDISTSTAPSPFRIDARSIYLTSTSGPVTGDFTLRDTLTIHTTSSSIDINLALLPSESNSTTTPALLDLKSASGSITVRTSTISQPGKIPDRDYRSTIHTNSGSITASLVHGSLTDLKSDSGSINAELHPHGTATLRSDISTRTLSGRTEVNVHPSLTDATTPLRNFFAQYHGVSGSMRISYPAQWEGKVEGSTVSGGIAVVWPGLKVEENRSGWGMHRFKGEKGTEGKGVLGFKDVSGRVELNGAVAVVAVGCEEGSGGRGRGRGMEAGVGNHWERVAREEDTETETEVGDEVLLTPTSEAGDEWLSVQ